MTVRNRDPRILADDQVTEAIFIIDDLGDISNAAPPDVASKLDRIRARLKNLINKIDDPGSGGSARLIA